MGSPASNHLMRLSAIAYAQQGGNVLRHAAPYEQMLVKLAEDKRVLKTIYSKRTKADKKRQLLPHYLPWVNGVIDAGEGAQDDVLMTVMLWRLDVDDIAGALKIAHYALDYGLAMPGAHQRPPPYMLVEEVALAAQRLLERQEAVEIAPLLETLDLTANADMPDEVRARLHRLVGRLLSDREQFVDALYHLQRAAQLDRSRGVKRLIEHVERHLTARGD